MKNSYCVYKHTSPSGKVYIGITHQNPENRWQGGLGYRHNEYFFRAILKYGWSNFAHEILHQVLTKSAACAAEIVLIAAYHSNEKAHGYKITSGGECFKHTAESIEKMRKNRKGKGHRRTPEATKAKIRANHKGGANPRPVTCVTTGITYKRINEAARQTGINKKQISGCCRGAEHYNTAGGFRWTYYEEQEERHGRI